MFARDASAARALHRCRDLAMETASVHTASNHGDHGDLRAQAKELDAGWMFRSEEIDQRSLRTKCLLRQ